MDTIFKVPLRVFRNAFFTGMLLVLNLPVIFTQPVVVSTFVSPPYSPILSEYAQYEGQIIVTLQNTGPQALRLKLGATVTSNNSVSGNTLPEANLPLIELEPFGIHTLRSDEIRQVFRKNDFEIKGIAVSDLERDRVLPEGIYQICIRAYNYDKPGFSEPLSSPEPLGCSNPIVITYLEPPQILSVNGQPCGSVLQTSEPQNVVIQWLPTMGNVTAPLVYTLTLVEVIPTSGNPNHALESAPALLEITTMATTVQIDAGLLFLEQGHRYAFRVKVADGSIEKKLYFLNQGYSAVCDFYYGTPLMPTGLSLDAVYPAEGDYIPFDYFPVVIRYREYSEKYNTFKSRYELRSEGALLDNMNRDANWPYGPRKSQEVATGMSISQEYAQLIAVNRSQIELPVFIYIHGIPYRWSADVNIGQVGTSIPLNAATSADFYYGMNKPLPLDPADGDTLPPGDVSLRFKTADPPGRLLPPLIGQTNEDGTMQIGGENVYIHGFESFDLPKPKKGDKKNEPAPPVKTPTKKITAFFNGAVHEKWVLEVSRSKNFETLTDTASGTIGANLELQSADESALRAALYKDISQTLNCVDTGAYFWRVKWLTDPTGNDASEFYQLSDVFHFYINGKKGEGPVRETPEDCLAGCKAPEVEDQTPVTTAKAGDVVAIGKFKLTISEISWAGDQASGSGAVDVPVLRAPVKVNFTSFKINAAKQVFDGEAIGLQNADAPGFLAGLAQKGAKYAGLSDENAEALSDYLAQGKNLVSAFSGTDPVGLPIGLDNTIDGQRYAIAIAGLLFKPEKARLNAVMAIDLPGLYGWLALGATDICFHPNGLSIGEGLLYTPVNKTIPWTNGVTVVFDSTNLVSAPKDTGTVLQWDCEGFLQLNLKGKFVFPRDWLVPDSDTGEPGKEGQVEARFRVNLRRKAGWLASLDFDRFQLAGLPNWGFQPQEAMVDFSEQENPPDIKFPEGYAEEYAGDNNPLWKGFYIKKLALRLPKEFSKGKPRIEVAAQDVLIDGTGLSGSLLGKDILNLGDGNLDSWAYSIDSLYMNLRSNAFVNAGMNGTIKVPIGEEPLDYKMTLNRFSAGAYGYEMAVTARSDLHAPLWAASLNLLADNSRIGITYSGGEFLAKAELNGDLSLNSDIDILSGLDFKAIEFEGLTVQSKEPYLSCENWTWASPPHSISGFPVTIKDKGIHLVTDFSEITKPKVGLALEMQILPTGNANTFKAETDFTVWGKLEIDAGDGIQSFKYDRLALNNMHIEGQVSVVSINGELNFYKNDARFGNGFRGKLRATFVDKLTADATAQFGSVSGYRYWYVDAMAEMTPGIPFLPGLDIRGFGGAAYYHMTIKIPDSPDFNSPANADTPGGAPSGTTFVPNPNTVGFALKALVGAPGSSMAYTGLGTFGATLNVNDYGIINMYLMGDLVLMSNKPDRKSAQVFADMALTYDFPNKILEGNFSAYAYIASGLVKGKFEGNRVGTISLYFSPDTWYIKMGEPNHKIGLSFADLFDTESYFMCGKGLPSMPPVPFDIGPITAKESRDPLIEGGNGFAFGSLANFDTKDLTFLAFYARFIADIGFDISVLDFGKVNCEGAPGDEVIGIDGWYATGQVFARFKGSVGIKVDMWWVSGKYEIFGIGAGLVLKGGFPNPSWLQGTVSGDYSILGGAVSGHCDFDVKMGEKCVPPRENPFADFDLLGELRPGNDASNKENVDCGVEPQAVFNTTLGEEMVAVEMNENGDSVVRKFRVQHRDFKLSAGGKTIPARTTPGQDNITLTLTPLSFLDPYASYSILITVFLEELVKGVWVKSVRRDGSVIEKAYVQSFRTGAYPEAIRKEDVLYSYPLHNQRFFLQNECRNGFLTLKASMPYLFDYSNYAYRGELVLLEPGKTAAAPGIDNSSPGVKAVPAGDESVLTTDIQVDGPKISFTVPSLNPNSVYAFRIVAKWIGATAVVPVSGPGGNAPGNLPSDPSGVNGNFAATTQVIESMITKYRQSGTTIVARDRRLDATKVRWDEKLIYVWYFKTSRFNTLASKLNAMKINGVEHFEWGDREEGIHLYFQAAEPLEQYEVSGVPYYESGVQRRLPPFIHLEAAWNKPWNTGFCDPYIYDLDKEFRQRVWPANWSMDAKFGLPPVRALWYRSDSDIRGPLTENEYLPQNEGSSGLSPLANMGGVPVYGFAPPAGPEGPVIDYCPGALTPWHFNSMRQAAGWINGNHYDEFWPDWLKQRLNRVLFGAYEPMYSDQYTIYQYFQKSCNTDGGVPSNPFKLSDSRSFEYKK